MFDKFRRNNEKEWELGSPAEGFCKPLSEVPDPVFSEEILGKGVAIELSNGRIVSPVNGVVTTAFQTGHALAIRSKGGIEMLIHIGIDTVQLNGKYFTSHVIQNQKVKKGDLLIEVDYKGAESQGFHMITPVIICNTSDYGDVEGITGQKVTYEDKVIQLKPKE